MIQILLFITTCLTTAIAGVEWIQGFFGVYSLDKLSGGFRYSVCMIFILSCHEFGHYFAAKYHRVSVTLPYFIPFPPLPGFLNFGTMGAVIRTKSIIPNNKAMFDIGVYGPIAGFVASILVLVYGFLHLPGIDYITAIHPNYFAEHFATNSVTLAFGNSILFSAISLLLPTSADFVPPMSEIYHYPHLCAGWFGLFLTAMNMIPVGQLDGGHIIYSMFGFERHLKIARASLAIVTLLGILGILSALFEWSGGIGWPGWLLWAFILHSVIKVKHPPVLRFNELDNRRKILGYASLIILAVSFSPSPFVVSF